MTTDNENNKPPSTPPEDQAGGESPLFEKVEGFRKGVESFLKDGKLRNVTREFKIPGEFVQHFVAGLDDTKKAVLNVVSKEIREFLEGINISEEAADLLTRLSLEIKTEIKFKPREPEGEEAEEEPDATPAPEPPEE